MALTTLEYVYSGQATFPVTFALGNLSRDYVTVRVNFAVDGSGDPLYYSDYSWLSDAELQINGLSLGDTVSIVRTVPKEELVSPFSAGADITRRNLDAQSKQAIMGLQEILDGRFDSDEAPATSADRAEQAANQASADASSILGLLPLINSAYQTLDDRPSLRDATTGLIYTLLDGSVWTTDGTSGHTATEDDDALSVVGVDGRLWKREFDGPVRIDWFYGGDLGLAVNAAVEALGPKGGHILLPARSSPYQWSTEAVVTDNIKVELHGVIELLGANRDPHLLAKGVIGPAVPVTSISGWAVGLGDTAGFTARNWVRITSDDIYDPGNTNTKYAEQRRISNVTSSELTLDGGLTDAFATNIEASPLALVGGVHVCGTAIITDPSNSPDGKLFAQFKYCDAPVFDGIRGTAVNHVLALFTDCPTAFVDGMLAKDVVTSATGYGFSADNTTTLFVRNVSGQSVRHLASSNNSGRTSLLGIVEGGGAPSYYLSDFVVDGSGITSGGSFTAPIDTHGACRGAFISNGRITGATGYGINIEGWLARLENVHLEGCGAGISFGNKSAIPGIYSISKSSSRGEMGNTFRVGAGPVESVLVDDCDFPTAANVQYGPVGKQGQFKIRDTRIKSSGVVNETVRVDDCEAFIMEDCSVTGAGKCVRIVNTDYIQLRGRNTLTAGAENGTLLECSAAIGSVDIAGVKGNSGGFSSVEGIRLGGTSFIEVIDRGDNDLSDVAIPWIVNAAGLTSFRSNREGLLTVTTPSSGQVDIPHGLPVVPNHYSVVAAGGAYIVEHVLTNSTNIRIKVLDEGGAAVGSTPVDLMWSASHVKST